MGLDYDEFSRLALAELDAVHRLAFHLSAKPHEAEDIVQETYLRAFKSWGSYQHGGLGIRPWLFKILHNAVYTRFSRDHREREVLADVQSQATLDAETGSARDDCTIDGIDWESVDQRLKQALMDLSLAHRTIFLLCAIADLSYREIAEVVGVPIGTVMSRLHRARTVLAQRLRPLAEEQGLRGKKIEP